MQAFRALWVTVSYCLYTLLMPGRKSSNLSWHLRQPKANYCHGAWYYLLTKEGIYATFTTDLVNTLHAHTYTHTSIYIFYIGMHNTHVYIIYIIYKLHVWGKWKFAPRISQVALIVVCRWGPICISINRSRIARSGENIAILSSPLFLPHTWSGAHQSPGTCLQSSSWKGRVEEVSTYPATGTDRNGPG